MIRRAARFPATFALAAAGLLAGATSATAAAPAGRPEPAHGSHQAVGYPGLRLVTCGGPLDPATRQYLDNIVVYAHLVSPVR